MEAFISVFVFVGAGWVLFCVLLGASLNKAKAEHEKEKARKLRMLEAHPELAKEIWQSIEDQETRYHTKMKNLGDAFQKAGGEFQKAVTPTPTPKSHNGAAMVKLGLVIAKRLIK